MRIESGERGEREDTLFAENISKKGIFSGPSCDDLAKDGLNGPIIWASRPIKK